MIDKTKCPKCGIETNDNKQGVFACGSYYGHHYKLYESPACKDNQIKQLTEACAHLQTRNIRFVFENGSLQRIVNKFTKAAKVIMQYDSSYRGLKDEPDSNLTIDAIALRDAFVSISEAAKEWGEL